MESLFGKRFGCSMFAAIVGIIVLDLMFLAVAAWIVITIVKAILG